MSIPHASGFRAQLEYQMTPITSPEDVSNKLSTVKSYENEITAIDENADVPDGGLWAYMALLGSFMGLVPVWGMINSLGALEGYISNHQLASSSSSVVSWIFSVYLAMLSASCVLTGAYFDRNGGKRPMVVGSVLYIAGILATANCQTVWQFILAFSILCGFATGALTTPLVSCVATWFCRKRAMATSIATTGGSLGGIIFPLMLRKLYVEVGFQWALRILALICFVCLTFAIFFARERVKTNAEPFRTKRETVRYYVASSFNWRYFLDAKFLWTTLGFSLAENSILVSGTFIASYAMARGNSEAVSFTLITTTNALGILGRFIPGYIADKYAGCFNVVIITSLAAALMNLCLWLPLGGNLKVLWAYSMLYGFLSGSIFSLTPVCIGQISRTSDFGKRYSTGYLLNALMTLPALPIAGALIGDGSISNYNNFIVFSSCLMLAGVLCYAIARYLCVGTKICKF